jgi:hypothetical protein
MWQLRSNGCRKFAEHRELPAVNYKTRGAADRPTKGEKPEWWNPS